MSENSKHIIMTNTWVTRLFPFRLIFTDLASQGNTIIETSPWNPRNSMILMIWGQVHNIVRRERSVYVRVLIMLDSLSYSCIAMQGPGGWINCIRYKRPALTVSNELPFILRRQLTSPSIKAPMKFDQWVTVNILTGLFLTVCRQEFAPLGLLAHIRSQNHSEEMWRANGCSGIIVEIKNVGHPWEATLLVV